MDQEPEVDLAAMHRVLDLVERSHNRDEIRLPELECQIRGREQAGHSDPLGPGGGAWIGGRVGPAH